MSTRFIYLDPIYKCRPSLFISTRFIYLDPIYLSRPGLFISTRFINVDPVYKRPKLLRFLLNLNFWEKHFGLNSGRLGIKGKTVLKNWVYSVSEIKAFRSSALIKISLAQLFSDSFVVFCTLYLLGVLVFRKVCSLPTLRSF